MKIDVKGLKNAINKLDNMVTNLDYLTVHDIKIGVTSTDKPYLQGQSITLGQLMMVHEYGNGRTPARPIIHLSLNRYYKDYADQMSKIINVIISDNPALSRVELMYNRLGAFAEGKTKQYWANNNELQALHTSTLKARRTRKYYSGSHNRPLIDSGHLRSAVAYRIVKA